MAEKRPYPQDGLENGDTKRTRSNNGSPVPQGSGAARGSHISEAERMKADTAARIAALKAKMAGQKRTEASAAQAPISSASAVADAKARIAAMRAKHAAGAAASSSPSPGPQSAAPTAVSSGGSSDSARKAQAQAQLEALKAKAAERQRQAAPPPPPQRQDNNGKARGGLGIGLHPALMGDLAKQGGKEQNREQGEKKRATQANPYLDADAAEEDAAEDTTAFDNRLGKGRVERKSRAMVFNQKGKFIAQAEALRAQERLEKMKQDMQISARKKAIEEATERSYLIQAPPDIEWWDEALVNGRSYASLDDPDGLNFSVITEYVQHPILIDPPQDKLAPAPKPMYLTKKEQAKLRRQRRMEDHKEEQTKIRLGLIPAPAPKVKKSNLMRVLGQEAVKDPTAVEARVNREIAARADAHEAANESRKLTAEQSREKKEAQKEADAAKGLHVAVFRIESLSYGKHRFQVDKNAKQHNLTGLVILHPKMNLVVVEGGAHGINKYKKLMLQRIRWGENAPPVGEEAREKEREEREWLQSLDAEGRLKDLSYNRCTLVWEGEEGSRAFKYWGSKECETDGEAKDALARMKMENMWTLAQSMRIE